MRANRHMFFNGVLASGVALMLFTGCTHLGPKTVAVDRFDYSSAIGDSWKQQTLLNRVKLRYMDLPVFVDVASIVSGYSMQTGVSVNGTLSSEKAIQGNYASIGGQAIYTDRPTVTYVPMTGEKFLRGLITPIDDRDWRTKRALTAVMFFFTLAETGDPGKLPLITIPAQ